MRKINLIILSEYLLTCIISITLFASNTLHAKTEVLFSPQGLIKDTIIKNIDSSEKTIDIAVFIFTAGEIAEALYEAKERGIKIRIVIDQRQKKKRYPVLEFLKEEGFDLQFLKGNIGGFMNNTFAIFDAKRLITGSYNWTEYAEKFNYENALFIDDPGVVKRFQEEFETLYEKSSINSITKSEDSDSYAPFSKVEAIAELNKEDELTALEDVHLKETKNGKELNLEDNFATTTTKVKDITETHEQKEQAKPTTETLKDFLNTSFNEFDSIFGKKSELNKTGKKQIWKSRFKGKYVKWTGKIIHKGMAVYDWNRITVGHEDADTDVQLRFYWTKQRKVLRLKVGEIITYTGKLDALQGFSTSYKVIDADVLETK